MQLLTTSEAAEIRLKERKLYELVSVGAIPCTKAPIPAAQSASRPVVGPRTRTWQRRRKWHKETATEK